MLCPACKGLMSSLKPHKEVQEILQGNEGTLKDMKLLLYWELN